MPAGSPSYTVDRTDRVYEWAERCEDPERLEALLAWLAVACRDPELVSTGEVEHTRRNQRILYSDVDRARTRVTFMVIELPVRCVRIVRISDADFMID